MIEYKKIIINILKIIIILLFLVILYLLCNNYNYNYNATKNNNNINEFFVVSDIGSLFSSIGRTLTQTPPTQSPTTIQPQFPYVTGRFFRISRTDINYINLGGLLIYDETGALINGDSRKWNTTISSDYKEGGQDSTKNCFKITTNNKSRTLSQVIAGTPLYTPGYQSLFNYLNWHQSSGSNITHTTNSTYEWWEFDFGQDVNIAGFEILPRSDCCPDRINSVQLMIFKDEYTSSHTRNPVYRIVIDMFANNVLPPQDSEIWKKPIKDRTYFLIPPPPTTTQPLTTPPLTTPPLTTQPLTTQPLTTQPLTTQPLTTQPLTTQPPLTTTQPPLTTTQQLLEQISAKPTLKPNDCNGISEQPNTSKNSIIEQCFNNSNCYYTNNGCINKSMFAHLPININNNFKCDINQYDNDKYKLDCKNIDVSNTDNYLFNIISQSNVCLQNDNNCNIIRMSPPDTTTIPGTTLDANQQLSTLSFINGMLQPLLLNNTTVNMLSNDLKTKSGILYFSDINNTIMPVTYNINKNKNLLDYTKINAKQIDSANVAKVQDSIDMINEDVNKILDR